MKFSLGLLAGALLSTVAVYLAGGNSAKILFFAGLVIPILVALKFPKAIASMLLRFAGTKVSVVRENRTTEKPRTQEQQESVDYASYRKMPAKARRIAEANAWEAALEAREKKEPKEPTPDWAKDEELFGATK